MKKLILAGLMLCATPAYAQIWGGIHNPDLPTRDTIATALSTTLLATPIGAAFDGGGSPLTSGKTIHRKIDFSGTITEWTMLCDVNVGSTGAVVDIWKLAYSTDTLPTVANSITASAKPTITSGHKTAQSSVLTGWTTTVGPGDVVSFYTSTISTATWCTIDLRIKP